MRKCVTWYELGELRPYIHGELEISGNEICGQKITYGPPMLKSPRTNSQTNLSLC